VDATADAWLIKNAEAYYRGSAEGWNLRDRHMFETLDAILHARDDSRTVAP
jgi:erythromycin esterase-like protein